MNLLAWLRPPPIWDGHITTFQLYSWKELGARADAAIAVEDKERALIAAQAILDELLGEKKIRRWAYDKRRRERSAEEIRRAA